MLFKVYSNSIKQLYIQCLSRKDVQKNIFTTTVFTERKRLPLLNQLNSTFKFNETGFQCNDTFLYWSEENIDKILFEEIVCTSKMGPATLLRLLKNDLTFKVKQSVSKFLFWLVVEVAQPTILPHIH